MPPSFGEQIQAFASQTVPAKANLLKRKLALQALTRLVERTPVDTGRARGNWQVTLGDHLPDGPVDRLDPDGSGAIGQGSQAIAVVRRGEPIWISNHLAYIEELEHGTSEQAPEGMLAVTMTELESQFQ